MLRKPKLEEEIYIKLKVAEKKYAWNVWNIL